MREVYSNGKHKLSLEALVPTNDLGEYRLFGLKPDQDKLPITVWVVLVPDPSRRDQSHLYRKVATDQFGHYLLRGIAPGDYKLFCWDEVEDGAREDPDFLRAYEDRGEDFCGESGREERRCPRDQNGSSE